MKQEKWLLCPGCRNKTRFRFLFVLEWNTLETAEREISELYWERMVYDEERKGKVAKKAMKLA